MGADRFDVGIIGAGTASEALARQLTDSGMSVVVFEPDLVGGECPFRACIPSKSMLHDSRAETPWEEAVARRREMTNHLDDSGHADGLVERGVTLVRSRAEIVDSGRLTADGREYEVEHVVIATGATPNMPPIEGADECAEAIWTSADAYTSPDLPSSMVIVGAGVVGMECASLYARYGTSVILIDNADRAFENAPPEVSDVLAGALRSAGVQIRCGVSAESMRLQSEDPDELGVVVTLTDGTEVEAERVLVAIGRRPSTTGLGLERLGVDPGSPLPLESSGQVRTDGSVWAIGDVAGQGQYTHLANHQATVVADHLVGTRTRRFDDVVVPRCMFTDPPLVQIGPEWSELDGDPDIVAASADVESVARSATDELPAGHLWVAARRSTGCLAAAAGAGPRFDELAHALVTAIDGAVPVARLRQSMHPFPTIGEILDPIFDDLHAALTSAS